MIKGEIEKKTTEKRWKKTNSSKKKKIKLKIKNKLN
jgi:hypothetical protein